MMIVKITIFDVPVTEDATALPFEEGLYKFWTLVGQDGSELTIRETVGKVSLQQRIDNFLKHDMRYMTARAVLCPKYIAPATPHEIAAWARVHPNEMKSFIWDS